ncbi:MAG: endonuclease/exonuclease/phosphatase family protein [Rubripirellula sp.]|nr:endonuclease/exonuclease/phosphatase family protein [Rubripirellula sp.]
MLRLLLLQIVFLSAASSFAVEPLKIVTYNIRCMNRSDGEDYWPKRIEAVTNFLDDYDLIGLQEVTKPQFDQLRKRLTDFDSYGLGRSDGKSGGEHAAIFFRRDLLEMSSQGTFWLSETPDQVGTKGWDADLPRTCTWMVLKRRDSEAQVWVANTHFDHRGVQARTESAKLIRRMAHQLGEGLPTIVMGDFNCLPGSDPYQALTTLEVTDSNPLTDARKASEQEPIGPGSTWNGFSQIIPDRIIDHLFVEGPVTVRTVEVLDPRTQSGRFASDHLPVTASIELK